MDREYSHLAPMVINLVQNGERVRPMHPYITYSIRP
nr:MAG TPA: hypothetical protein [Caudoviricetes sp.]